MGRENYRIVDTPLKLLTVQQQGMMMAVGLTLYGQPTSAT